MDPVDRDQEFEQALLERRIAVTRSAMVMQQTGDDCLHCGHTIDEGRRAALPGCALCRPCQAQIEGLRQ